MDQKFVDTSTVIANQPFQVASLRSKLQNLLCDKEFPQILLRLVFPKNEINADLCRCLDQVIV